MDIKVGIIGLGRGGFGMQCSELDQKKDRFRIVAGCDIYAPWRDRMKERYPDCRLYGRIEELLEDSTVELVSIATRSVDHFDHAILALNAGKQVLVDKPMCINAKQAEQLQAIAKRSAGRLFVRHNRRFDPDFLHVKEIIDSGLLGYVHTVKLARLGYSRRCDWQTLKENGGGQLLNWGPHLIDQGLQLADAPRTPLKGIWADCKRLVAGGDCEDHVKVILIGSNGCLVDIEISGAAKVSVPEYTVLGTRGSLVLSLNEATIELNTLDPSVALDEVKVDDGVPGGHTMQTQNALRWIHKTLAIAPSKKSDFWDELYRALVHQTEFSVTLEQAVEVMKVVSFAKQQTGF